MTPPYRQVRAHYDTDTVRVYQAYSHEIADAALEHGRFVSPPFSMTRTTWIKPSFLWMMYRCGWTEKDAGQARVLAIDLRRTAFDWILANGCLSHYDPALPESAEQWRENAARSRIVVQWDPERSLRLGPLSYRSIQIGLRPIAVPRYVSEWTAAITDVTPLVVQIRELVRSGNEPAATALLPMETPYPVDEDTRDDWR
jgi:hypothetical protein